MPTQLDPSRRIAPRESDGAADCHIRGTNPRVRRTRGGRWYDVSDGPKGAADVFHPLAQSAFPHVA